MKAQSVTARRLGIGVVAIAATLLTAACATGQNAMTAEEVPAIDGTQATVGKIDIRDISIQPPSAKSYSVADDVELTFVVANTGTTSDALTRISSPDFTSATFFASASNADAASSTPVTIAAGSSVSFGIDPSGAQASLNSLTAAGAGSDKGLFPGELVPVTFSFKNAGSVTAQVPVALTGVANTASVPAS